MRRGTYMGLCIVGFLVAAAPLALWVARRLLESFGRIL